MNERPHITLVTGGARSGKSALAETLCRRLPGPHIYIATAEAHDGEMTQRIDLHRQQRGDGWLTVEAPRDLIGALRETDGQGARLVDCLTMWLANVDSAGDIGLLCETLAAMRSPVVLVTNELGNGIVPMNPLARAFRDNHGRMNQAVATVAGNVWMSVCGLPVRIKPGRDLDDFL